MISIEFNLSPKFITKNMQAKIKKLARNLVYDTSAEIERGAIRNFKRAEREVPADNPEVLVVRDYFSAQNVAVVTCGGEQLLFIEFGAGSEHYYEGSMVSEAKGERAPRKEIGILDIGEYGKHRGKDRSWVYLSSTGREALHTHLIGENGKGQYRMRTGGIRPQRALWRARNNAIRKVIYGKGLRRRRLG